MIVLDSPVPPSMPLSTVTASTLIDKAAILLQDVDNVRWPREELLGWLNDAQVAIVQIKPGANNKIGAMKLQPGARQTIPADGWLLLEITRNLGADGRTPGPAIQLASRDLMERFNLDMYSDTSSAVTQCYMFTLQDQPAFYVYPPSTGTNYVEINYSFMPEELDEETDTITIRDIYYPVILDYMLYRAHMKDAEHASNGQLANAYYAAFAGALGVKEQGEMENNPNLGFGPYNPAVRGASK